MLYKKFFLAILIVGVWSALIFLISRDSKSIIDPIFVWAMITQIAGLICGMLLIVLRLSKVIYASAFLYILFAALNLSVWIYFLVDAARPGRHYSFWYNFLPTMLVSMFMLIDIARNGMKEEFKS